MRSEITGRYIIFGSSRRNFRHSEIETQGISSNQLSNPKIGNKSEALDFRSPSFGLKYSPSLGAAATKNMGEFYMSHCPEDMHKLNTPVVKQPKEYLEKEFNDDLNVTAELDNVIKTNQARKSAE